MTPAQRVSAVQAFGFTERQARFLVTVMLHGGVCVVRQYCAFVGIERGQVTHDFFGGLVARKFASRYLDAHRRFVIFHVHHKALYAAIGEPDSRFRKPTPLPAAVERLMVLDAVLQRPDVHVARHGAREGRALHPTLGTAFRREDLPHLVFGQPPCTTIALLLRQAAHRCGRRRRRAPVPLPGHAREPARLSCVPAPSRRAASRPPLVAPLAPRAELTSPRRRTPSETWRTRNSRAPCGLPSLTNCCGSFVRLMRRRHLAPPSPSRFAQARRAFSAPRYRRLYRTWRQMGRTCVDATVSRTLADAVERGLGRGQRPCASTRVPSSLSPGWHGMTWLLLGRTGGRHGPREAMFVPPVLTGAGGERRRGRLDRTPTQVARATR